LGLFLVPAALANVVEHKDHAWFQITSTRSGTTDPKLDIPDIEVVFPNGVKQKMILRHYDGIPNSDLADPSLLCNYLGHLEGDEMHSVVAVTGCLMRDDRDEKMHITLISENSPKHKSFSVDKNGITKPIKIQSKVESRKYSTGMDDSSIINKQKDSAAAKVSAMDRSTVPPILTVKIRLGYDKSVKQYFGGNGGNVDNWMSKVMTHSQAHFLHSSLKHKIIFEVTQTPFEVDDFLTVDNVTLAIEKAGTKVLRINDPDIALYAVFINLPIDPNKGAGGAAYLGGACNDEPVEKIYRYLEKTSITRGPSRGVVETAETLVHEIGHGLGMQHDFIDDNICRKASETKNITCSSCANYQASKKYQRIGPVSGNPNDCCNGFMGYSDHPHYWSECSVRMFEDHYEKKKWNQCMAPTADCKDANPKCQSYLDNPSNGGCFGQWIGWFEDNCQKTCNYCIDVNYCNVITCQNGGICREKENSFWPFQCECQAPFYGQFCEVECKNSNTVYTDAQCESWKNRGFCNLQGWKQFMTDHCSMACGFC